MDICNSISRSQEIFYYLLACVVQNGPADPEKLRGLSAEEWQSIYNIARSQGVSAVIFDRIKALPKDVKPPKKLLLTWIASAMAVESKQLSRRTLSDEFANELSDHGIRVVVLKGICMSLYYPNPLSREFGDFDCLLFRRDGDARIVWDGCYEEGNVIAEKLGANVKRQHYKHSHISLHGLMIENHQYALPIRGNDATKNLERHLRHLLEQGPLTNIADSNLFCPPASYNALFLTAHSLNHFLYESINFRHILDWALFLKAEAENVDWADFMHWCQSINATRFVYCLNFICKQYLGLDADIPQSDDIQMTASLSELILKDIFNGFSIYNKGYSTNKNRLMLIKHFFDTTWKYRMVCQTNAYSSLLQLISGFLFDRNPKL